MSNVQFQNESFVTRKFIGKIQTAENVRISVKQDIAQVLSLGIDSCVNSYEASDGEASFYGKTNIRLLYSDGVNVAGSSYNADFTASIQSELIQTGSKMCFDVVTVDTKVDANANTATLTVLLEITAYAYVTETAPYFAECDDAYVNVESVETLLNADVVNIPFVLDEELSSTRSISTVLLAESNVCVTNYSAKDGVLQLSGEGSVRLTYLSDGEIVTDNLPFSFARELDAENVNADGQLKIRVIPKATKVRLDISDGDVNTTFTVEIGLTAQVDTTKVGVVNIVTDAYADNCDFLFERKTVWTTLPCGSVTARKQLSVNLPSDSSKTFISAVNVGAIVTNCQSREANVLVEGIVTSTLLYSTETGVESEQLELPFTQSVDVDYIMPQCRSCANVTVLGFDVDVNNGIVANVDMCVCIDSERDVSFNVITQADEKPFDKTQLAAIEVCLARKGETLWNLAKNLHMSADDLLSLNPEISNPLQQDARIVVYNKI